MGGFDRSKLKTTSGNALDKQKKEQEKKRPKGGFNSSYFGIDDGVNKVRFFPFHPDDSVPEDDRRYAEAKCVSFLEVNKPKKDESGKVIDGEFELKKFPIFNARVHGDLSMDPVEEYMKFAKETAIPNYTDNPDEVKKIWNCIIGYRDNKGQYHSGLKPNDTWVMYALKLVDGEWKLGQLEVKKTVKDQLTELALEITEGENPDPYTDPNDGYVVKVTRTGEGINTKYKVSIDDKMINKIESNKIVMELTDEQLDEWMKLPSLRKMFVKSYRRSDFESQLDGLKRFDEQLKANKMPIEVFSYDAFLDTLEKIDGELPKEEESKDEKPKTNKPATVTTSKPKVEEKPAIKRTTVTRPPVKIEEPVADIEDAPVEQEAEQVIETSTKPSGLSRLEEIRRKHSGK